jgi:Mg2+/Co2+ transporter CorB
MDSLMRLITPLGGAVRALARRLLRPFGPGAGPDRRMDRARRSLTGALAHAHSEGAVAKEDRDRLMGALDLADRTVEEVMLHRSKIEMVDADAAPEAILTAVLASPHSRLPVFRGERENILGVIHAKDLLRAAEKAVRGEDTIASIGGLDILNVAKKPYFVPDTTPLDEQMREFLKRRSHFALVVDEYGALRGLITLEDILEEIVGEIADEFDIDPSQQLKPAEGGDFIVDGAMTIRDLNRAADWTLPDDEANTIAGLVIHEAQMIPAEGQVFSFHGFRFEVLARKENRITRLKVRPL